MLRDVAAFRRCAPRDHGVTRRHALGLLSAMLASAPARVFAEGAADAAYTQIAHWLFDRYVEQAIAITRHNAAQKIRGAAEVIDKEAPALTRFLGRHRDAFTAELMRPLKSAVAPGDAPRIAAMVATRPPTLDKPALDALREVDLDFRRNSQRVLRAMTFEVDLLVEQVLENLLTPKN